VASVTPLPSDRRGFVLGFVIMMLFAISVMGATGYLVVNSEFTMSKYGSESAEALTVARAGLQRFVAEHIGVVGDSVSYAIGDGVALIISRKVFSQDSVTDVYLLRAEATVSDVFTTDIPAKRAIEAYAIHHRRPLAHHAAVMITSSTIRTSFFSWTGTIHAVDSSTAGDCPGGGASTITGAISRSTPIEGSGDIVGSPETEAWGTYDAMYDSVALRWDVLQNPNFPVEYEDQMPDFSTLPADSFPVIRFNGSSSAFGNSDDGRGVLIVAGQYSADSYFDWEGIILAGSVSTFMLGTVRGMFVGGLDGNNPNNTVYHIGETYYYSCKVYAANESLSYLELLENTAFEAN